LALQLLARLPQRLTGFLNMRGVNGDRLITDGMAKAQPVAPNDKSSNKALNRRVKFLKQ
jgi:outer membrane protein OmpA-like peptidoglycan-associated protein